MYIMNTFTVLCVSLVFFSLGGTSVVTYKGDIFQYLNELEQDTQAAVRAAADLIKNGAKKYPNELVGRRDELVKTAQDIMSGLLAIWSGLTEPKERVCVELLVNEVYEKLNTLIVNRIESGCIDTLNRQTVLKNTQQQILSIEQQVRDLLTEFEKRSMECSFEANSAECTQQVISDIWTKSVNISRQLDEAVIGLTTGSDGYLTQVSVCLEIVSEQMDLVLTNAQWSTKDCTSK